MPLSDSSSDESDIESIKVSNFFVTFDLRHQVTVRLFDKTY